MKLPNKFEFKVYDLEYYIMAKHPYDGEYYCYDVDESTEDQNEGLCTAEAIGRNVTEGRWVITKDLDEPIKAEPEMVFPFSYKHSDESESAIVEMVGGKIKHSFSNGEVNFDVWDKNEITQFIKDGTWIVTGVGKGTFDSNPACVHEYFWGDMSEAEGEHNPVVPSEVGPLTIKIDSSQIIQATEAIHNLGEAIDKVKKALYGLSGVWREANGLGERVECVVGGDYKVDYKFLGE